MANALRRGPRPGLNQDQGRSTRDQRAAAGTRLYDIGRLFQVTHEFLCHDLCVVSIAPPTERNWSQYGKWN
jgi:hypothetical protein